MAEWVLQVIVSNAWEWIFATRRKLVSEAFKNRFSSNQEDAIHGP